jgi:hypothetical protein
VSTAKRLDVEEREGFVRFKELHRRNFTWREVSQLLKFGWEGGTLDDFAEDTRGCHGCFMLLRLLFVNGVER